MVPIGVPLSNYTLVRENGFADEFIFPANWEQWANGAGNWQSIVTALATLAVIAQVDPVLDAIELNFLGSNRRRWTRKSLLLSLKKVGFIRDILTRLKAIVRLSKTEDIVLNVPEEKLQQTIPIGRRYTVYAFFSLLLPIIIELTFIFGATSTEKIIRYDLKSVGFEAGNAYRLRSTDNLIWRNGTISLKRTANLNQETLLNPLRGMAAFAFTEEVSSCEENMLKKYTGNELSGSITMSRCKSGFERETWLLSVQLGTIDQTTAYVFDIGRYITENRQALSPLLSKAGDDGNDSKGCVLEERNSGGEIAMLQGTKCPSMEDFLHVLLASLSPKPVSEGGTILLTRSSTHPFSLERTRIPLTVVLMVLLGITTLHVVTKALSGRSSHARYAAVVKKYLRMQGAAKVTQGVRNSQLDIDSILENEGES